MALTTAELFDDIGERYDDAFEDRTEQMKSLEWMLSNLPPGSKTLDIGCGPGTIVATISERGHDALGIDVSPVMVSAAQKKAPLARFEVADFVSWSAAPGTFDGITMYFALIPNVSQQDIRDAVAKVHTMLKNGGLFVYASVAVSGEKVSTQFLGRPTIGSSFNVEETVDMIRKAGFQVEDSSDFVFQPKWIEGLCRPEEAAAEPHVFVCSRKP